MTTTAKPILKVLTKTERKLFLQLQNRLIANEDDSLFGGRKGFDLIADNPTPVDPVQTILDERGSRYGDFSDHARLAQQLQACLREHKIGSIVVGGMPTYQQPWLQLDAVKKQALIVITDKLARILNGDSNYADNWVGIQGYARLVEERLPKVSENGTNQATPAS